MTSRPAGKLLPGNVFLSICGSVCLGVGRAGSWSVLACGDWVFEPASRAFPAFRAKARHAFEAGLPVALGLLTHPVTMRSDDVSSANDPVEAHPYLDKFQIYAAVRHKAQFLNGDLTTAPLFKSLERSAQ